ncbi:MAG: Gfo/Idh/MocA family oxidoreductase [Candidatus Aminicenantes bacterium]|nr:Gfo/Idh/MocA family oxidoreductase [Candidatus Aminicenantes bacterium]
MNMKKKEKEPGISRRDFIKASSTVSMAAMISGTGILFASGSDKIRVGLIGCGGRGTGAAIDCVNSSPNIVITAMGDLFKDRLDSSLNRLKKKLKKENLLVSRDAFFFGFDAFKKVIACDVDMVILGAPPHFRPEHLKAAVEANKHIFMEKPVAVDPTGVRSIITSSNLAEKKRLAIVAGTQRRHQAHYLEIMKRIHKGAIGEIVSGQCYWNMGALWVQRAWENWFYRKSKDWSDMEWHCRNWLFLTWLSGDHIVEQHVHNLDVINWAIGSHPVKCTGMGGRQVRTAPEYGNIFDHFAIEYEYPNGARVMSMCRQTSGCSNNVSERVIGTKGSTYTDSANGYIQGANAFKYEDESPNPYVQEHTDLIKSIRNGKPLNEGKRVAESTLTAIMGRMSAYTGRSLSWDWVMKASKLDLSPPRYVMGELPVRPVAVPGETQLI